MRVVDQHAAGVKKGLRIPKQVKKSISGSTVLGDKAYGSKEFRDFIKSTGASYCIPPKTNAEQPWEVDYYHYKERRLVECFFKN